MNKAFRIGFALLLLAGILLLASNGIAWAGGMPSVKNGAEQAQNQSAALIADAAPGSVKPPPVVVPRITEPGTYPVGGVCILYVERLADDVSLHVQLLPFDVLKLPPKIITRYLAGVCSLNYHVSGKPVPELLSSAGSVKICFAALPRIIGTIYVYDNNKKTWTPMFTTLERNNKLACTSATLSGRYVLVATKP